jgi:hypothetical protein
MTVFSTVWAMPSRWTFSIPPVTQFLYRWLPEQGVIVDPFCGQSQHATHGNDLAQGGVDAAEYCERLLADGVVADAVLFDPPYSPRQIAECYKSIGREVSTADTQNAALYARVRKPLAELLKSDGIALSFGWQSSGFGKAWETLEIMLVQHGGAHNDTICVAQRPRAQGKMF